jgi:hypothetical protein
MLVSMISPFVYISNVGTLQNNLKLQFVPHGKHSVSIATSMVREIIPVYCASHTKTRERYRDLKCESGWYWFELQIRKSILF